MTMETINNVDETNFGIVYIEDEKNETDLNLCKIEDLIENEALKNYKLEITFFYDETEKRYKKNIVEKDGKKNMPSTNDFKTGKFSRLNNPKGNAYCVILEQTAVILDIDKPTEWKAFCDDYEIDTSNWVKTKSLTCDLNGGGKFHYWFKVNENFKNRTEHPWGDIITKLIFEKVGSNIDNYNPDIGLPEFDEKLIESIKNAKKCVGKVKKDKIVKDKKNKESLNEIDNILNANQNTFEIFKFDFELKYILGLLEIIKKYKLDDYSTWLKIGIILKGIDKFDLFVDYSKCSAKFVSVESIKKKWDGFEIHDKSPTAKSLRYMANECNEIECNEFENNNELSLSQKFFNSLTIDSFANFFKFWLNGKLLITGVKNVKIFLHSNHIWGQVPEQCVYGLIIDFKLFIFNYIRYQNKTNVRESYKLGDHFIFPSEKISDIFEMIHGKLTNTITNFKNVIANLHHIIFKPKWEESLDIDPFLMAFTNGVVDIRTGDIRDGVPEDNISCQIDYDYKKDIDKNIENEINNFFSQLFSSYTITVDDDKNEFLEENTEIKDYMLDFILPSILEGDNIYEKFYIWLGRGGNGKSKLLSLMEFTLGKSYTVKIPVEALVDERKKDEFNKVIAGKSGALLATTQESEEGTDFNVGMIKGITGRDTLGCRSLYSDPKEIVGRFKLILATNNIPNFPPTDEGFRRRIEIMQFDSRFLSEKDISVPNNLTPSIHYCLNRKYPYDIRLLTKLENWKQTFISMLIRNYGINVYNKKNFATIDFCENLKTKYFDSNDILGAWIKSNYKLSKLKKKNHDTFVDDCYVGIKNIMKKFIFDHPKYKTDKKYENKDLFSDNIKTFFELDIKNKLDYREKQNIFKLNPKTGTTFKTTVRNCYFGLVEISDFIEEEEEEEELKEAVITDCL